MRKSIFTSFFSFFLFIQFLAGQCITNLNFHQWHATGNTNVQWVIESDSVLRETSTGSTHPPAFFIKDQDLINVKITGTMRIEYSGDDDFIGFVFGYRKPGIANNGHHYEFILFDWKGANGEINGYNAYEGFMLTRVDKSIAPEQQWKYFWGHADEAGFDVLDRNTGPDKGWEFDTDYHFELTYTSTRIIIQINGEEIFDVPGCFQAGGFGFYAFSQQHLQFRNFDYRLDLDFKTSAALRCPGENIEFIAIDKDCAFIPPNITNWSWDFGDGNTSTQIQPLHAYDDAGTYNITLIVKDNIHCHDTSRHVIKINPYPEIDLFEDTLVNYGDTLMLNAGNPGAEFLWSNGGYTQEIRIDNIVEAFPLEVEVTKSGCTSIHQMYIDVIPPPTARLFMPNAFTPNGDGINDVLKPAFQNIQSFELSIFDKWGTQLFRSDQLNKGWDGKFKGQHCPVGTYVYVLTYSGLNTDIEIQKETKTG
ncbi:MAG: gliding motility-associated C-terminal domain-containing protein, partial [Bacteroidales bacterium]|nr:gliding motility-associated C-terminal domain-containing protein [Bacteroidales bacterium]